MTMLGARPRCFAVSDPRNPPTFCGEPASWQRPCDHARVAYFCDLHRSALDAPIALPAMVPRLQVVLEFELAGVSWNPAVAKAEAVNRLTAAVGTVGGVLTLDAVLCTTARYEPRAVDQLANASRNGGE